jgi:uncharacterized membrane protein
MYRAVAIVTFFVTALPAHGAGISDADALEIVRKHCVMCHAARPSHESFQDAPNNVTLESIAEIRKHAVAVYTQTVQTKPCRSVIKPL